MSSSVMPRLCARAVIISSNSLVRVAPGLIVFTRMLCLPASMANNSLKPMMPHLETQ